MIDVQIPPTNKRTPDPQTAKNDNDAKFKSTLPFIPQDFLPRQ